VARGRAATSAWICVDLRDLRGPTVEAIRLGPNSSPVVGGVARIGCDRTRSPHTPDYPATPSGIPRASIDAL